MSEVAAYAAEEENQGLPDDDQQTSRPCKRYPGPPLDANRQQIRLLHLKPGRSSSPLQGQLITVDLTPQVKYEALSYTWGALTKYHSISLNGNLSVVITDNLYDALRGLRRRLKRLVLWVDALCINQDDFEERASQVQFMGEIYKMASMTYIWLGGSLEDEGSGRKFFRSTQLLPRLLVFLHDKVPDRYVHVKSWASRSYWTALESALKTSSPLWHTRAWVFQEFVNSRKTAWCFGVHIIILSAKKLLDIIVCGDNKGLSYKAIRAFVEALIAMDGYKFVYDLDEMTPLTSRRRTLYSSLLCSAGMNSADPRDRLYSLRGLVNATEAALVNVDYKKDTQALFLEISRGLLETMRDLRCLELATMTRTMTRTEEEEELPTWAISFVNIPRMLFVHNDGGEIMLEANEDIWPQMHPRFDLTGGTITLRGVFFDRVFSAQDLKPSADADQGTWSVFLAFPPRLSRSANCMIDGLSIKTAFGLEVTRNHKVNDILNAKGEVELVFRPVSKPDPIDLALLKNVLEIGHLWGKRLAIGRRTRPYTSCDEDFQWDVFLQCMVYSMRARRKSTFWFTTDAGFLGIAQGGKIEAGDIVALVKGCRFPLLLRQHEDSTYSLIGHAFIDSIHDGQLKSVWERNGINLQEIVIR